MVEVLRVQERSSEMWTPRNLKLATRSTSVPLIQIGVCAPPLVLLKSTISSLVFMVLRARLLLAHHSARCWTSFFFQSSPSKPKLSHERGNLCEPYGFIRLPKQGA